VPKGSFKKDFGPKEGSSDPRSFSLVPKDFNKEGFLEPKEGFSKFEDKNNHPCSLLLSLYEPLWNGGGS